MLEPEGGLNHHNPDGRAVNEAEMCQRLVRSRLKTTGWNASVQHLYSDSSTCRPSKYILQKELRIAKIKRKIEELLGKKP